MNKKTPGINPTGLRAGTRQQATSKASHVDLKTLSEHLGLSKGTISRALNGYPEIAAPTRARVVEAAARLGYKPNRVARRLATGRNELISYVALGSDWMTVERSFLSALSSTLAERGYGLLVSLADTMAHAQETMKGLLEERRVDGFVFNLAYPADGRIALAADSRVPAVVVGGGAPSHSPDLVPTIRINDGAVMDGLVDYMTSLGHSRFAYFGQDAPPALQKLHSDILSAACRNRNTSFVASVQTEPQPVFGNELATDGADQSLAARAHAILEDVSGQPTAVFCGCERTVAALYMAAVDRGLSVPGELSIIGIGSTQLASWLSGGLSTVSWSLSEAGRLGADCITALVEGQAIPTALDVIEAEFHPRATHGPAPR
ncbi:MAG: LacI family DNA-binding transcriptional regulator [Cohaesibacteraceae bacterium]